MTQDRKEGRDSVLETVLDEVRPDDAERASLNEAYERVKERAEDALEEVGVEGEVELVGSTARDTWLSGDKDIDVFLLLPESLERDEFEEVGLDVGKEVFPDGEVEYAEHPYVKGHESGFDVDV
ncbi:MAG: nucleotidyltransferase domain-containing protein, partial [Halobacteria archaeon]|nr:nucleotidyltransferase domain-containing protein [Halobacteria archaeon]